VNFNGDGRSHMPETCVACGVEIVADAARCSGCGLAFLPTAKNDPLASQGVPRHVEHFVGQSPSVVPSTAAGVEGVDFETPVPPPPTRPPVDPKARRRRWIVATAVVVAVVAGAAAFIHAHRPNDEYTKHELAFERFLDSDRLAPVDVPDAIDVDATIAEIGRGDPDAVRAATAAYKPLPDVAGLSLHQFFDAFLARVVDVSPDYAFHLGIHPHPHTLTGVDEATRIRWIMLCRDASRALATWPGAERLSPHDRADRDALLSWIDSQLRWRATRDIDALHSIVSWSHSLDRLVEMPCCPVQDRVAAAVDRLGGLPARLDRAVAVLKRPPRALVLSTAAQLDDVDAYLSTYADAWRDASPDDVRRLRAAVEPARQAVVGCACRLRGGVLAAATGDLAIGRENVADVLRVYHRLPLDARTVYENAVDELRAAHDEMRRLASGRPSTVRPACTDADDVQVRELRRSAEHWVTAMPPDDGVIVSPMPRLAIGEAASASYLDPGALATASIGVVHVRPRRADDGSYRAELETLRRRHMLAHETYPGHRMAAVFQRSACALRSFVDDRVFVEGWGAYSEELLHETGDCADGPIDDWVRAEHRATRAYSTMIELLIATGAASDDDVLGLLKMAGWPRATVVDLGVWQSSTLYELNYFLGIEEIRRLRRDEEDRLGRAFDLRAFHAKLLAEGPIQPRLIEEEWRAQGR
jgi:uncharacterized protein (DUF885 family)